MTTNYTKVAKVTGTTYTKSNVGGGLAYDDAVDTYDSATDVYDGGALSYTKIAKITNTTYTKITKPT